MTSCHEFTNNGTFRIDKVTSKFICDNKNEPTYIYRYDEKKFEIRRVSKYEEIEYETSVKEMQSLHSPPIDKDGRIRHIHDFYVDDKLYFLIAVIPTDYFECFFYLLNYSNKELSRFLFKRPVKGIITNIYVSPALKSETHGNYRIITIGTLDSALYVFRIANNVKLFDKEVEEAHLFDYALLRTDARNSLVQQIIELEDESKSLSNVYVICGGFNGILDFFLLKSNSNIDLEPDLQFVRHGLENLPSNLPISSIQSFKLSSTHVLLAIGQELEGQNKRSHEPSMSFIKLYKKNLEGRPVVANKYPSETRIMPVIAQDDGNYITRSVKLDEDAVMVDDCPFNVEEFKFVRDDKKVQFFEKFTGEAQQIVVSSQCWILTRTDISRLPIKPSYKGSKRKLEA